ncbi:MAG TPA: hypothetical protein VGM62_00675 [Chthoniobacterales bacterium]|jgi:hypothetical protein
MTLSRPAFVRLWLFPACLVILLRFVHGTNLGYDPTIQLQATQNLLAGHGLTVYSLQAQPDLAAPNRLEVLTYFPAGYSICAAAIMAVGAGPATTLKILGAIGTILGWWGWARLAYSFMRDGMMRSVAWRYVAAAIALMTPVLTTPLWTGTDIFLWAAVPWTLQLLARAAKSDAGSGGRFDFIAGVITGFAVLLRYQSLFLVGYGGLVIACQSLTKASAFFRRCLMFTVGVAPFLALQLFINHSSSSGSFNAGGVTVHPDTARLSQYLRQALISISAANHPLIWWTPRAVAAFFTQGAKNAPWLVPLTYIVLIIIPVAFALRLGHRNVSAAARDVRSVSVGLLLVLPLFLWACAFGGAVYVGVIRYYQPLIPLAVLAAYSFAAIRREDDRIAARAGRLIARGYVAGFVFMMIFGIALLSLPGERGGARWRQLLGAIKVSHWFSTDPKYMFSPARAYVVELLRQHPETILVTNRENWFYADPAIDRSRIHRLEGLNSKYVTGPAHILIFAAEPSPGPDTALYWFRTWGSPVPATNFEPVPDLHLVRRFPDEELKILEADIPSDTRIELKHPDT